MQLYNLLIVYKWIHWVQSDIKSFAKTHCDKNARLLNNLQESIFFHSNSNVIWRFWRKATFYFGDCPLYTPSIKYTVVFYMTR